MPGSPDVRSGSGTRPYSLVPPPATPVGYRVVKPLTTLAIQAVARIADLDVRPNPDHPSMIVGTGRIST